MMNTSQIDFLSAESAQLARTESRSQNEIIRDYLSAHPGEWVSMPILARLMTETGCGAAVHSRIADCRRKYGMNIHNKARRRGGRSQSWYCYEPDQSAH